MFCQAHKFKITGGNFYVVNGDVNYNLNFVPTNLAEKTTGTSRQSLFAPGDIGLAEDIQKSALLSDHASTVRDSTAEYVSTIFEDPPTSSSQYPCPLCHQKKTKTYRDQATDTGTDTCNSSSLTGPLNSITDNPSPQGRHAGISESQQPFGDATHLHTIKTDCHTKTEQFNIRGSVNLHVHAPGSVQVNVLSSDLPSVESESEAQEPRLSIQTSTSKITIVLDS